MKGVSLGLLQHLDFFLNKNVGLRVFEKTNSGQVCMA